jgi:hypothetical protein
MSKELTIKPQHRLIHTYYEALKSYGAQGVMHEGALETAFQRLLADTARSKDWTLIPKLKMKVGGKTIFPDGTLRDEFNLPRGYWEAKDTDDDLNVEIAKKIEKGYPLTNTIFEDTRHAVLYQGSRTPLRDVEGLRAAARQEATGLGTRQAQPDDRHSQPQDEPVLISGLR